MQLWLLYVLDRFGFTVLRGDSVMCHWCVSCINSNSINSMNSSQGSFLPEPDYALFGELEEDEVAATMFLHCLWSSISSLVFLEDRHRAKWLQPRRCMMHRAAWVGRSGRNHRFWVLRDVKWRVLWVLWSIFGPWSIEKRFLKHC